MFLSTHQVQQIQEEAAKLIVAYSGEKARDIQRNEMEVVNAWRNLQLNLDTRKHKLDDSNDLYRFFGMVRDLLNWMTDMSRQMTSSEKPRYGESSIDVLLVLRPTSFQHGVSVLCIILQVDSLSKVLANRLIIVR